MDHEDRMSLTQLGLFGADDLPPRPEPRKVRPAVTAQTTFRPADIEAFRRAGKPLPPEPKQVPLGSTLKTERIEPN